MERRILIIDDHNDLCSALKKEFENLGHQVKTVETRVEACQIDEILFSAHCTNRRGHQ